MRHEDPAPQRKPGKGLEHGDSALKNTKEDRPVRGVFPEIV